MRVIRPKYSSKTLKGLLEEFFGELTLRDVETDVCITGVALQSGRPRFHKSDYMERNYARLDEKLRDIAQGASAAPTYFEAHSTKHSSDIIDGGICANNPTMIGLVEAAQFERPSKRGTVPIRNVATDLLIVSVGTGLQPGMPYDAAALRGAGLVKWAEHITDIMLESQSQLIDFQAKFLLKGNYLRINPQLAFPIALDDVNRLGELRNVGDLTREVQEFVERHAI